MRYSYSRVDCYKSCPRKYRYRYVDKLQTIPDASPDNALYLGIGLHTGVELTVEKGIEAYKSHYPVMTNEIINWTIQLEYWIPKVKSLLPLGGQHEFKIIEPDFIGFIDYVCGDTIFDFKFSNAVDRYKESPQLSIYKYYYEKATGRKINHLKYIMVPKCSIRQKTSESVEEFRIRLLSAMESKEIQVIEVPYDELSVVKFFEDQKLIENDTVYRKSPNDWCKRYCEYYAKCFKESDENIMELPKNQKKKPTVNVEPDLFIYAQSYVGKSTFADGAPDVLFINTDGNTDELTSPSILIANEVKTVGRMTTTKLAWEVFKEVVDELEKKENDFKYVAIDLLEDLREHCRVYIYKKMGISHESDAGYGKAYDMVVTEWNTALKRIKSAGYHIILISKEVEGEVKLKSGGSYTTFKPNLPEKVANTLAGMVDITARAFVDEGGKRWLQLGKEEHTFGGGRINFKVDKCDLSFEALVNEIKKSKEDK